MCGAGGAALAGGTQAASSRGEPGGSADALRARLLGLEAAAIRSLARLVEEGRWEAEVGGPAATPPQPYLEGLEGPGRGFPSPLGLRQRRQAETSCASHWAEWAPGACLQPRLLRS